MSQQIRIVEPLGERAGALPLDVGGEGASLAVPGAAGTALSISASGRQWLVQPADGSAAALNGIALRAAQPLAEGDVLTLGDAQLVMHPDAGQITVAHLAGNATVAPLRQQLLPGDEVVAGVREIIAANAPATTSAGDVPARGRVRWIAGSVAAVLLLAAVGLLIALVPVALQVNPAGTRIQAPGSIAWQTEGRIFLLPGRRTLNLTHQGYLDQTLTLDVTRALRGATPLNVALEYLPGVVEIDTGGVATEVLVDGRSAGHAPGEVSIAAGARTVVLRAERHVDHVAAIEVAGGGQRQSLKVQLQPSIGFLALDTQPAGAVIRVDGQEKGAAPQTVELDAGLHQLTLSATGRRAWSSEIAIIAGQTLDLGRIDLAMPPAAALRAATSQPSSAADASAAGPADPASATAAPARQREPPPSRAQSALLGTLVLLPAGSYLQGSERREQGRRNNEVQRTVKLTRGLYMSATEVSNVQFRTFKPAHVSGITQEKSLDLDTQAVSSVSWNDAVEFCNWLSLRENLPAAYERRDGRWQLVQPLNRGYRLPTEAEWEYAVRYVDGQRWQRYAWGDALPPPTGAANLAGEEIVPQRQSSANAAAAPPTLPQYRDEHAVIAPVGSYAATPAGLFDLGGNVSEWTHDVYESLPATGAITDPMGPAADGPHAIRGPNWRSTGIAELRAAWRERAASAAQTIGFRVVRFAEDAP